MAKLRWLLELCEELGVETSPGEVRAGGRRVLIVPLLSFHHPQWDEEPDVEGWEGIDKVQNIITDYHVTRWPKGVRIEDGSAAREIDRVNDEVFDLEELVARRRDFDAVVSFSHFLARPETNPEKRYLLAPNLAKAVGSIFLRARVERLRPDVHVFGHTHFGYDLKVDGVRYVQAPLAMPMERVMRTTTLAVGDFLAAGPEPFLLWSSRSSWVPSARGAWSEYSLRYGRRPEVTSLLPSYVANRYRPSSDSARVGWLPGRVPVWLLGPRAHRVAEMGRDVAEVRKAMEGAGAAGRAASAPDPSREPRPIAADELLALLERDRCVVVEIHEYAAEPGMPGVRGSVRLPHPACTEAFPGWEDEEMESLVARLMAKEGPRVLVGQGDATRPCRHAAFLLAAFLRLASCDIRMLSGGIEAWAARGLPMEALPL